MDGDTSVFKILTVKIKSRPLTRPRRRWEDNIIIGLKISIRGIRLIRLRI